MNTFENERMLMAVNHEQAKFSRMPRGRNQMPYYGPCPDNEMMSMQRGPCYPDAYGNKMDGPCGMGMNDFKSPMMNSNPPPQPAKKKRRTSSNAVSMAAQSNSSSVIADLLPPPLSGFGDTVVASNPFDDTPTMSSSRLNPMSHDKLMGVGPCMSPAGNPMMGSMSPCQMVGPSMSCGPSGSSSMNCGPSMGNYNPMSNTLSNSNCGPMGNPLVNCNGRQVNRSPLICSPMGNNSVMGNNGMNPMNRSPSSIGSPLGSVMGPNVRGSSPLDCGLGMSSVGSQKGSPMSVMGPHSMNNLNCGSPIGSPSNIPMNSCNNGNMIGSPITSPLNVPCSMSSSGELNSMNMNTAMNRGSMNAGPNSIMCNPSIRGPSPMGGSPMMNCNPGMSLGSKPDMNMNEMSSRDGHMPLKPLSGPGGCMNPNMAGVRPSGMGCGPMNPMHCNTMVNNQCAPNMMIRGPCGPGPGPGPSVMMMNNMYDGMNPNCRPGMNRPSFPRTMPGVGYGNGMSPMNGPGVPNGNLCGSQNMSLGGGTNQMRMHGPDVQMNTSNQFMGQNLNQCSSRMFDSQFNQFDIDNARCSPSLPFSVNDINPMGSSSNLSSMGSMANSICGNQNNNFSKSSISSVSCMSTISSFTSGTDSLNIGHSIISTGSMKNDCSTVDSELNSLACSMVSDDPIDDFSLLDDSLLQDAALEPTPSSAAMEISEDRKSTKDLLLDTASLAVNVKEEGEMSESKLADTNLKQGETKESKPDTEIGKNFSSTSPSNSVVNNSVETLSTSAAPPPTSICKTSSDGPNSSDSTCVTNCNVTNDDGNDSSNHCDVTKIKTEIVDDCSGGDATNASEKTESNESTIGDKNKNASEQNSEGVLGSVDIEKNDEKNGGEETMPVKIEEGSSGNAVSAEMENDDYFDRNLNTNNSTNNDRSNNGDEFNNGNVLITTATNSNFSLAGDNMSMNNMNDSSTCGGSMLPNVNRGPAQSMNCTNSPNASMYPGRGFPPNKSNICNAQNSNTVVGRTCGQCLKELKENDEVVICESGCINKWHHRICVGLTEDAYKYIKQESLAEWVCDKCLSTKQVPLVKLKSANEIKFLRGR